MGLKAAAIVCLLFYSLHMSLYRRTKSSSNLGTHLRHQPRQLRNAPAQQKQNLNPPEPRRMKSRASRSRQQRAPVFIVEEYEAASFVVVRDLCNAGENECG
jgi:hypothetical protein